MGIGTTTLNTSAALDITSNTKGLLTPRMTNEERAVIINPALGLMVYVTNFDGVGGSFMFYNGYYCASFRISSKMGVAIDSGSDHMGFRTVATKKMITNSQTTD